MHTLFLLCAVIGGSVLILQTLLLMFGIGDGADAGTDGFDGASLDDLDGHDGFFQFLSIKTVVAFLTFFGLAGLGGQQAGWSPIFTLLVAVGAGGVAIYLVAGMMQLMANLQSGGSVDLRNAIGNTGTVYLRVPAARAGVGRVTVAVQGRTVECKAVTAGPDLATGAPITVLDLVGEDTLEVAAL